MSVSGALRVTLPPDETAPALARAFLGSVHCACHDREVLDDAALLVSELVTNAVRHAAPPITLEVVCQGANGLSIRVSDGSPLPPSGRALTPHEESGRGIALVDLLSEDWGVEPVEPGKAVWFRLARSCTAGGECGAAADGTREEPRAREPSLAGFCQTPGS